MATLALAPARLAGNVAGVALRGLTGGDDGRSVPVQRPTTVTEQVEEAIFRGISVDRRKVDVVVSRGVVRLRGEVRTLKLRDQLATRAAEVPGVRSVENELHLPTAPAPKSSRSAPAAPRRTRRPAAAAGRRTSPRRKVNAEAPAPAKAEPTPKQTARRGKGRSPAPLGSKETPVGGPVETQGPDAADLDKDPAYQPTEPGLRKLKGG
jgi:hypothetical protein